MTQAIERAPRAMTWRDVSDYSGYSAAELAVIRSTVAQKATPVDMLAFLAQCKANGDDPFRKGAYLIPRKGRMVPQPSIDGYRARAARTREYAGSDDIIYRGALDVPTGRGKETIRAPEMATATVWRSADAHRKHAFTATCRWSEYYPGPGDVGRMWRDKPYLMLGKCAEALALRKGFPDALSDLPDRLPEEADEPPTASQIVHERANLSYDDIFGPENDELPMAIRPPEPDPEPDPQPDPEPEDEDQDEPEQVDEWARHRALSEAAARVGVKVKVIRNDANIPSLQAYNDALEEEIREREPA